MNAPSILNEETAHFIVRTLSQLLADTYVLYVKTQNFHWNVVDFRFFFLHKMLEEQYEELAEAVDVIAERIRVFNQPAPGSMRQFLELSSLNESEETTSADDMIFELLRDHESIGRFIRPKIEEAEKVGDQGTADLLIDRLRTHEKMAWMLRSHLIEEC